MLVKRMNENELKAVIEKVLKEEERCREGEMFFCFRVWRELGSRCYIPYEDMGTKLINAQPTKLFKIREKVLKEMEQEKKREQKD